MYGYICAHVDTCGNICTHLHTHGCTWIHMDAQETGPCPKLAKGFREPGPFWPATSFGPGPGCWARICIHMFAYVYMCVHMCLYVSICGPYVSNVLCPMSRVPCPISRIPCPESRVPCPVYHVPCHIHVPCSVSMAVCVRT